MIWVIIIVIILFFILFGQKTEYFDVDLFASDDLGNDWEPLWVGEQSDDCYSLSKGDCLKYSNCGLCHQKGKKQCIPGNVDGPLFKEGCDGWTYTNYYDRHIFNEAVTQTTPSWDKWYPNMYEVWYPSPITQATLQSFKEQA